MSNLTEMKSILDRQVKGVEGANVGVTNPSDGNYYTVEGSSDSPFDSNDHMVDLLDKDVLSENSGITHQQSPNSSQFQDLDGEKGPIFGDASGEGKQLGGKDLHERMLTHAYTNNGVTVGPSPGPSGHSEFQDLDGSMTDAGNGYFHGMPNPGKYNGKQLGGVDLHEAMLTQAYTNNGVTVGPSPGPSGHSSYQDIDGSLPNHANYSAGKGPSDGHY